MKNKQKNCYFRIKPTKKKQRRKHTEKEQKHKNQRVSMVKNDQLKIKNEHEA